MSGSETTFDPDRLERDFGALESLDRSLWLPVSVNTEGRIIDRISSVGQWVDRLLGGDQAISQTDVWPDETVRQAFDHVLRSLALHRLTRGHESLTNQVIKTLLWHIDRIALAQSHLPRAEAVTLAAQAFYSDWEAQRVDLSEVLRIFETLDGVENFAQFSALQGLLRDESWQAVIAANNNLTDLLALKKLIQQLGRRRPSEDTSEQHAAKRQVQQSTQQWVRQMTAIELPGSSLETEGVRRSGDLSRLLPSEAMQLRRPEQSVGRLRARRLRRLFAARLAEQSLLTYQQKERWLQTQWVPGQANAQQPSSEPLPRFIGGPIVLCVDTSSSMAGGPESIAKAVVLQVMKTAHQQQRACKIIAFSGPGELRSETLSMTVDGILRLSQFLAASYHGGTDIVEPIEQALLDCEQGQWCNADIVIVSDGEFGATAATRERLDQARRTLGLKVQGILIGDRETMGLRALADDIYWMRDWRRFGQRHGQTQAPVHSHQLTKLYFPNAENPPGQPASPV